MKQWTLTEVLDLVNEVTECLLDPDEELLYSDLVDSLGLIEIAATLRIPFDRYSKEAWGTARKLYEEVTYCTLSGLLTGGESPTQHD